MSNYYNKDKLKEQLDTEQIFDLLDLWGAEPEYVDGGLIAQTICHNLPGEGSRKLYYYENTKLCMCYSSCGSFDIFELAIKVAKIQQGKEWELYDAMHYIATYFGIDGEEAKEEEIKELADWDIFKRHKHDSFKRIEESVLPEYNPVILTRFAYPHIASWEREGITYETSHKNLIGFYAGNAQITIPHFDINNRLIGIRGRYIEDPQADRFGKYRPLLIGKTLYNHPLSMNLYNLNKSKDNIKRIKTAIILESEKSCLQYQSYYGQDNDISVACCGSSISNYHIFLLRQLGIREIILAFDRQFQEIGDEEFKRLKNKILHLNKKYGKIVKITAIFDKNKITKYKASPTDEGIEKFETLLKERIVF